MTAKVDISNVYCIFCYEIVFADEKWTDIAPCGHTAHKVCIDEHLGCEGRLFVCPLCGEAGWLGEPSVDTLGEPRGGVAPAA